MRRQPLESGLRRREAGPRHRAGGAPAAVRFLRQVRRGRDHFLRGGGRRLGPVVGGFVEERTIRLVADGAHDRNRAAGRGPDHRLVAERQQVLEGAAAPGDDDQVEAAFAQGPEAGAEVGGGADALHRGVAVDEVEPGEPAVRGPDEVVVGVPGGGGQQADAERQVRERPFPFRVEQPFPPQPLLPFFEFLEQRAPAGSAERADVQLVVALLGPDPEPPAGPDPVADFRAEPEQGGVALPDDGFQRGIPFLEGQEEVIPSADPGEFPFDPDLPGKPVLDGALHPGAQLADGERSERGPRRRAGAAVPVGRAPPARRRFRRGGGGRPRGAPSEEGGPRRHSPFPPRESFPRGIGRQPERTRRGRLGNGPLRPRRAGAPASPPLPPCARRVRAFSLPAPLPSPVRAPPSWCGPGSG